jgi:DNA-binding CsgD family transcriptional regulator
VQAAWALTARGADLERLGAWFSDGEVGGVVLTGPPGVGKTRLAEEALRTAGSHPTARAVGHEATRAIPFGALAHLLPADLLRDVGVGEDDRAALFHRARLSFAERAGEGRVLLLVDDVDQLDDTSLALLLPLTTARVIFLVATIRAGRPVPAVIASLVKDGHLVEHELATLTTGAVATLLHRVLDGPVEASCAGRLAAISEGNLQVLQEVVRSALDRGSLRHEGGVWRLEQLEIPGSLEQLVASHLAELDNERRSVLDVLAVAGSAGLADVEADAAPGVIEQLEARGFVRVTVDGRRTAVALAHPLYGEVIRQRMHVLRRRTVQRALADRLEAHGLRRREDLSLVAGWRLEAGGEVDAQALLDAGRLALAGRDAPSASRFAAAAAARGRAHDAARIEVEAAVLEGDTDGVERAVAAVWDEPDLPDAHRAHLCRRLTSARFGRGDLAGAVAAVDEAARSLTDPTAVATVQAQRALLLARNGHPQAALDALDHIATTGDPGVRIELASARSIACASVGCFADALEAARLGARTQQELPAWLATRGMAAHLVNEAHAYGYGGWFAEARELAAAGLERAEAGGALAAQVWLHLLLGEVERDAGYGRASLTHFTAAVRDAGRAEQHAGLVWAHVGVAQARLLLGDVPAAATALDEADAAGDSPVATSWATRERTRAWLRAGRGDLPGARRLLLEVAAAVRADGVLILEAAVLHDVVRFGDPSSALDRLEELGGMVEGPLSAARAAHARAAAAGDVDRYGEVIDRFEAMDDPAHAAEAAAEAAELHRRRGEARAAAAADRRVAALVERCGARTPGLVRGGGVEPLTPREREVALLAAAGTPSREIAERLFLSTRTVDTHLARVYRKLGISGREGLDAALAPAEPTA